jgi:hypothetical protein
MGLQDYQGSVSLKFREEIALNGISRLRRRSGFLECRLGRSFFGWLKGLPPLLLDIFDDHIGPLEMFLLPHGSDGRIEPEFFAGTFHSGIGQLSTQPPMPTFGRINTNDFSRIGVSAKLTIRNSQE